MKNKGISGLLGIYRGLPGPVYILFIGRIINRMGDFVRAFLTIYLSRYLGMDEARIGAVVTLTALAVIGGSVLGGKLCDRAGRKKILLLSFLISAGLIGICGFIPDSRYLPHILILAQFFSGAIRPVNSAMVTDLTSPENRHQAFSLLYLGINIGVSVGPLIAGFLFNHYRRWIFWGDALTTLAAALLILLFVPETIPAGHCGEGEEAEDKGNVFQALGRRPFLLVYLILTLFSSFVYAQSGFALPLQMNVRFLDQGARIFGYLMSCNAVTVLVATPLILRFLGRRRPLQNLMLGGLFYAAGFGMLMAEGCGLVYLLVSTVIWTLGEVVMATFEGVFVANQTPINHRGRFNAVHNVAHGLGGSLGPVLSGLILASMGYRFLWILIVGLAVFHSLSLIFLSRRMQRVV